MINRTHRCIYNIKRLISSRRVLGIVFVLLVVIFLYSGNSYPYTPIVGKPSTMLEKLDHGIKINGVPNLRLTLRSTRLCGNRPPLRCRKRRIHFCSTLQLKRLGQNKVRNIRRCFNSEPSQTPSTIYSRLPHKIYPGRTLWR